MLRIICWLNEKNMFLQYVLKVCGPVVSDVFKSGGDLLYRPISSGTTTFGTKQSEWPVSKPIPKLSAKLQVGCTSP